MSKYRSKSIGTKIVNRAGGEAYKQSTKLELISLLLTSFMNDKFYESETEQVTRLRELINNLSDKKFIAKALIYARNEFGMRSVTHVGTVELSRVVKKEEWFKNAVVKIVRRADDPLEMLGYFNNTYSDEPIPNNLKKGLALSIEKFNAYQLSKYKGSGKDVKMVDLFNIVHPKPKTSEQELLYKELMTGTLAPAETWETSLTQAGQKATDELELKSLKAESWKKLIDEKKLGYFALLRNLRNIIEQADIETKTKALEQLVNKNLINKSLVLPFRFKTAYDMIDDEYPTEKEVLRAITKAMEISLSNCPKFDGKTLVVLDTSGSMTSGQEHKTPAEIGSLFASILIKTNDADFISFSDNAKYFYINPDDSLSTMINTIKKSFYCGGTDFHAIFSCANKTYDRIIILSDMQGWIGYSAPTGDFNSYKSKFNCNPYLYSFDLNGYGDMQFPEKQVFCIAGFSDKIFDVMKVMEQDPNALINKIEAIEL
jgi:60 kDa SS-A/Ro ribonucleoprotein